MIQIDAIELATLIKQRIHDKRLADKPISVEATKSSFENPYASFRVKINGNEFLVAISGGKKP